MSPLGNMPCKAALTVSLPSQLMTVGDWPRPRQGSRGLFSSWRFNSTFRISIPSWMMPDHENLDLGDDGAAPRPGDISRSRQFRGGSISISLIVKVTGCLSGRAPAHELGAPFPKIAHALQTRGAKERASLGIDSLGSICFVGRHPTTIMVERARDCHHQRHEAKNCTSFESW